MKKRLLPGFLFTGIVLLLSGCYYDNEEELYPDEPECATSDVRYSTDVLPILENNCYRCHDSRTRQGGITLEGYDNLKVYVDNGRFLGAVSWASGYSPMPQDAGQLNDCSLQQIEAWINAGAANN